MGNYICSLRWKTSQYDREIFSELHKLLKKYNLPFDDHVNWHFYDENLKNLFGSNVRGFDILLNSSIETKMKSFLYDADYIFKKYKIEYRKNYEFLPM